jgi:hypothetical protein
MEPISMLAAGAATLFATKMIEEAGSETGKGLSAAAGRLITWLRGKGREDPETGAAMTMVQAAPTDPGRIDLLAQVRTTRAAGDQGFAAELRDLVGRAQQAGDIRLAVGGAHIHGNVSGGTVTQIGGNQQLPAHPD